MRCGAVVYATTQGLGMLGKSFYDAGVVTDVMVFKHPHEDRKSHMEWYPPGTIELTTRPFVGEAIERWLDDLQVVLFFETPFDWKFADRCRERGVKTVLIPMYEWSLQHPPHRFDKFICPSLLDMDYFPSSKYNSEFIPIPISQGTWNQRTRALRFLHNAGHIGSRNHKGTLELMRAMRYVNNPIALTIRSQHVSGLKKLRKDVPEITHDGRVKFEFGEIPYEQLFGKDYDVYVAPEKYNGLSLPLQEARAAGMLVMTTDRFPTNTWLPKGPLIPPSKYERAQTMKGHLEFDEAIVDPQSIAAVIDSWYEKDITEISAKGRQWAEENSWDVLKPKYLDVFNELRKNEKLFHRGSYV